MARPTVPTTGGSDVWGTTLNDAIFDVSDRLDAFSIANLPAGSVVFTTTTTRPTARTDICVIFTGSTDPGSNALTGDIWMRP